MKSAVELRLSVGMVELLPAERRPEPFRRFAVHSSRGEKVTWALGRPERLDRQFGEPVGLGRVLEQASGVSAVHGVALSASQIYRLVGDKPERTSFTVLGTLIDTLDCTVEDLCTFHGETAAAPKAVNASPAVIDLNTTIRPKRARVRRTD